MSQEASEKTTYLITRVLRNPHLWVVSILMAFLIAIHYNEVFRDGWILSFGLTRQTLWRILFLIPITYGAAFLGVGAGLSILALAVAAMVPRIFLISTAPREALFETCAVILTGALIVTFFNFLRKGKQRLAELETTQRMLNLQIKRLGMLYAISNIVNSRVAPLGSAFGIQSPEPRQFLAVVDKVKDLLGVDAAWLYLWDEEKEILELAAFNGLAESVAQEMGLGEGFDGIAAQSGQPVVIENVSADPIFKSTSLKPEGLQSVIVVPFMSKDEIGGTLGAGAHLVRRFSSDEVDLLHAIGDQISMAVENARLYQNERLIAEALRVSERNYRELFENASDAIWVHDLNGTIIAANKAVEKLSGFTLQELFGKDVREFLTEESLNKAREVRRKLLAGEETARHYEQELVSKKGNHTIIQLSTSLITKDGQPWAFQHIARDITEEKRIQDNLRFYVKQVSQAQEAERKRIARELHDETAQALIAVSRNLDDLASDNSQLTIKDIREQVKKILKEVRYYSQELRPSILDDLGLLPAVRWLASDLSSNYGIATDVEEIGEQRQLPSEAELMLFRIVQEALSNVRRHSGATKVFIKVRFADQKTKVTVSDNGKGFEMPARVGDLARIGKLGLAGMQERAQLLGGTLAINSRMGKGTTVTVEVPL